MSTTAGDPGSEWRPTPEAQRVHDAFEMHEFGVALYRQRIRRENPTMGQTQIEELVREWLVAPPPPDRLRNVLGEKAW